MSVKTGKEAAISGLREYQQELLSRLSKLRTDLEAVQHSLELLGGAAGEGVMADPPSDVATKAAGPQHLVERFLKDHPGQFFRPSVAARLIRKQGYSPKNVTTWPTLVTVAMKRLCEKGVAVAKEEEGKRVFGVPEGSSGVKT